MKLEDQVCTLEQAKKLAESGVKRDSVFMWWDEINIEPKLMVRLELKSKYAKFYPAYTIAELGEMLERYFNKLYIRNDSGDPRQPYISQFREGAIKTGWSERYSLRYHETLVQAYAKALIWLLDQKLSTAQQINEAA